MVCSDAQELVSQSVACCSSESTLENRNRQAKLLLGCGKQGMCGAWLLLHAMAAVPAVRTVKGKRMMGPGCQLVVVLHVGG